MGISALAPCHIRSFRLIALWWINFSLSLHTYLGRRAGAPALTSFRFTFLITATGRLKMHDRKITRNGANNNIFQSAIFRTPELCYDFVCHFPLRQVLPLRRFLSRPSFSGGAHVGWLPTTWEVSPLIFGHLDTPWLATLLSSPWK